MKENDVARMNTGKGKRKQKEQYVQVSKQRLKQFKLFVKKEKKKRQ